MPKIDRKARRRKRELARELRQRSTPEESRLWKELRTNKLDGTHFRHQHGIGGFIVDFYCAQAKLVGGVRG
jgi:very-short-patch-repair endonuclease